MTFNILYISLSLDKVTVMTQRIKLVDKNFKTAIINTLWSKKIEVSISM